MLCFKFRETLFTTVDKTNCSDILYILPLFSFKNLVKLFRDLSIKLNKSAIHLFTKPNSFRLQPSYFILQKLIHYIENFGLKNNIKIHFIE